MAKRPPKEDLEELRRLAKDPVRFVRGVLRAHPTPQQIVALRAIAQPGAHVSIRAGHGVGKSTLLSWMILWFLLFHEDCKVPCTAPSSHQLHDVLWAEVAKWRDKLPLAWKKSVVVTAEKIYIEGDEKTRYAVARTARKENPDALQGFHASNILFICEEASGIEQSVFEVAEGALSTPSARVVLVGNPTRTSGYFYDSQKGKQRHQWLRLRFSCTESSLVDESYITKMKEKYGENSNVFRVRVLGEFPETGDDCVISRVKAEKALNRELDFSKSPKVAGLDVARFGSDKTALVVRQGGKIVHMEQWSGYGIDETIGRVVARHREGVFDMINVDAIGLGAGVADMLPHYNIPTIGINVGESSSMKDKFNRLRDEVWFNIKDWIESPTCTIPADHKHTDDLIEELCSITYNYTPTGKVKVEGKDEMKARGLESPNLADALGLTLYNYTPPSKFHSVREEEVEIENSPSLLL